MGYKTAWHFSNGYLSYARKGEKIKAGNAYACKPDELRLCDFGFHSSYKLLDALKYAPGSVLSYCEIGGLIIESHDKNVSSIRRHLVVLDISHTLHQFASWCAEQALALIDEPDPRSLTALQAKRLWLDGKATDDELAAVRVDLDDAIRTANHVADAAYRAVDAAVRDAHLVWNVAWGAAFYAAGAADDAAGLAARAAARAAASSTACVVARAASSTACVVAYEAEHDACVVAYEAERDAFEAERDAQEAQLRTMVLALPEFAGIAEVIS